MTMTRTAATGGAGRPFTTDLTDEQRRNYTRLTTSIADAIDDGQSVPCLRLPGFFDVNLTRPRTVADSDEERTRQLAHRRQLAALREGLCHAAPCYRNAPTTPKAVCRSTGSWPAAGEVVGHEPRSVAGRARRRRRGRQSCVRSPSRRPAAAAGVADSAVCVDIGDSGRGRGRAHRDHPRGRGVPPRQPLSAASRPPQ